MSRRCGLFRMSDLCSPEPPSPLEMYMTRHEMPAAEPCWPFSGHDTPYQFSSNRICNRTVSTLQDPATALECHEPLDPVFLRRGGRRGREHVRSQVSSELGHSGRPRFVSRRGLGGTLPVHVAGAVDRTGATLDLRRLGHRHGLSPSAHPSRIRDTAVARMHPDRLRHARIARRSSLLGRDPSPPSP
jgi:hypothetical protein